MPSGPFSPVWVELFKVGHYGDGFAITSSDLSLIQRNFQKEGKPIPVGIGLNWSGSPLHASIDQMEVRGDTLWGRLTNITPQMDEIVSKGIAAHRVASVAKSVDGMALKRVGFADKPTYSTALSGAVKADFNGDSEVEFFERKGTSGRIGRMFIAFTEEVNSSQVSPAGTGIREINRLKRQGQWPSAFDRFRFDRIFSLLGQSNARATFGEGANVREGSLVECFSHFLEQVAPVVRAAEIGTSSAAVARGDVALAAAARQLSRDRGVTYAEALDLAIKHEGIDRQLAEFSESGGAGGDDALHMEALRTVKRRGVSYCEALEEALQNRLS